MANVCVDKVAVVERKNGVEIYFAITTSLFGVKIYYMVYVEYKFFLIFRPDKEHALLCMIRNNSII